MAGVNATDWGHQWDDSVSTFAELAGRAALGAMLVQGVAALIALVAVWRAFGARDPAQLPVLLCAGLLASPHVSNYDLIGLAIAALRWCGRFPPRPGPSC